ncbi:unnamed protein product [Dicrocoelium dendriticum]|nr:unnamed protein product [Dicrocoelium dendriticum]
MSVPAVGEIACDDLKERLIALEKLLADPLSDCYIERLLDVVIASVNDAQVLPQTKENEYSLAFYKRFAHVAALLQSYRRKPQDFSLIASLGHGAFGRVQLVREVTTGRVCAMKVLKKSRMLTQHTDYWIEREIMARADSPWIVQLYHAFQDVTSLYMVMEYVPGGNLVSWMEEVEIISEAACRFYAAETVLALADLHAMGFIHRDIKPDNLLLDVGGHVKLADFGTAVRVDPNTRLVHCDAAVGTPDYLSPEVLLSQAEAAVDRLAPLIGDSESAEEVRFLLLEQRFLEHLEANEVMPAVTLLRNRITPMQRNTDRVHTLASCLMCRTNAELRAQAGGWPGKDAGSRLQLIDRIQTFVPAKTMLPPRRLEELIEESIRAELSSCIFHNPPVGSGTDLHDISLLQRHSCGMRDFPAFCIQTVHQRDGELWLCQFSPDGYYLAVGGKDANVDVLRVDVTRHTVSRYRVLTTPSYIGCLCWSPDSKKLAACCGEEQSSVCVFDMTSGQQLCSVKVNDEDTYTTAAFFADSCKLAFGGLKGVFYVMDTNDRGRILASVEGYRVQSMAAVFPLGLNTQYAGSKPNQLNGFTAPGGPDCGTSAVGNLGTLAGPLTNQVDQLLVADSLHRIRLFRFGPLGSVSTAAANDIPSNTVEGGDTPSSSTEATTTTVVPVGISTTVVRPLSSFVDDDVTLTSINPAEPTTYSSSGGSPGGPTDVTTSTPPVSSSASSASTTTTNIVDNPSVAAALAVARLSRQQRLTQSINTSTGNLSWGVQSSHTFTPATPQGSATIQTCSASSTVPSATLIDMPILPANVSRITTSHMQQQPQQQQQSQSNIRSVLHHSGSTIGGTPYTVLSPTGSSGLAPGGSSLTILFGAPLERSSAAYTGSSGVTTEVRALTAAAAAAALAGSHSRSFAGLVHSLSTMVAANSDTSAGRVVASETSASSATVCTTSTSTTTTSGLGSATSVGVGTGVSSAASTTVCSSTGQPVTGSSYGLLDHLTLFKETHAVQSISMSRSGQRALITIHKMGLHLWDVESCAIIQRFVGYKQEMFRLHSTFGGTNEQFVATGSENGRIHIWHVNGGNHSIHSASNGSRDAITCVHWNPMLPTMLASVSDGGEVCIWGPQRYVFGTGQPMEESS